MDPVVVIQVFSLCGAFIIPYVFRHYSALITEEMTAMLETMHKQCYYNGSESTHALQWCRMT